MSKLVSIYIDVDMKCRAQIRGLSLNGMIIVALRCLKSMGTWYQPQTHPALFIRSTKTRHAVYTKIRISDELYDYLRDNGFVISQAIDYALRQFTTLGQGPTG